LVNRTDSLAGVVNKTTGLGIRGFDPSASSSFANIGYCSPIFLNNIYRSHWAARKVVDYLPSQMIRRWGEIKLGSGDVSNIAVVGKKLNSLRFLYELAQKTANLCGGAAIIRLANDGLSEKDPLIPYPNLQIEYSPVLDSQEIFPEPSALRSNWHNPEYYLVHTIDRSYLVHKSRVIRFNGLFAGKEGRLRNMGWDDSVLIPFLNPLMRHLSAIGYVAAAVKDFEVFVHYIQGLFDRLDSIEGEEKIATRLLLNQQQRSSLRGMVADLESEKLEYVSRTFTGVGDVLDRIKDEMVAASGLTKPQFLQEHPSGLAATGESERLAEADAIEALQERQWGENIRFDCALALSNTTEDWDWEWKSLYRSTPSELAKIKLDMARTDLSYERRGILSEEEIRNSRFSLPEYSQETVLSPP
jgi:uncharacterized protein